MTEFIIIPALPEIFLALAVMVLVIIGVFKTSHGDGKKRAFLYKLTIIFLIITGVLVFYGDHGTPEVAMGGMFILDKFAVFVKIVILAAAVFVLTMSFDTLRLKEKPCFEFSILLALSVCGMMVMVSANDLMSLYMGLELQSLSLYVMTALNRTNEKSSEAALKYFMLGALASGILLYGCSLIYGFSGTTNFTRLEAIYGSDVAGEISIGALMGLILVIVGLCFKVSAVPFHMWTPDVYEGASKQVTAFFATAPKVAALALFVRFTSQPFGGLLPEWQQVVIFVAIASMIVGSFGALAQHNIKRLIAYSSIGHAGFILIGLAAGNSEGVQASLIYMAIYMMMNIGVFACILLMKRHDEHVEKISDLSGLNRTNPMFAFVMAVLMFSMAGVPPMAGFFGKFFVLKAALHSELYGLAITGVLASVVSAYYYLRVIKIMYFDPTKDPLDKEAGRETKIVVLVAGLLNLIFFIFPAPLFDAAKLAAESLM